VELSFAQQSPVGQVFIHEVSRSHTTTHHTQWDSSGRVISSSQSPQPANTTLTTDIHATSGILTHKLSRRAAADLRLRPRGPLGRVRGTLSTKIYPRQITIYCTAVFKVFYYIDVKCGRLLFRRMGGLHSWSRRFGKSLSHAGNRITVPRLPCL
jgi:hypothetical protein